MGVNDDYMLLAKIINSADLYLNDKPYFELGSILADEIKKLPIKRTYSDRLSAIVRIRFLYIFLETVIGIMNKHDLEAEDLNTDLILGMVDSEIRELQVVSVAIHDRLPTLRNTIIKNVIAELNGETVKIEGYDFLITLDLPYVNNIANLLDKEKYVGIINFSTDSIGVQIRAIGLDDISWVTEQHFFGGGHPKASGGRRDQFNLFDLSQCVDWLKEKGMIGDRKCLLEDLSKKD